MNGPAIPHRVLVQQRDLELLSGLLDVRVMTLGQVVDIHFLGKRAAAKERVRLLKRAGIIEELPRRRFERSVLTLTSRGIGLLRQNDRLAQFASQSDRRILRRSMVSRRLLAHELLVSETKALLYRAAREDGRFCVESFYAWPGRTRTGGRTRRRGTLVSRQIEIRPDAVATIRHAGKALVELFVEVDRSTESWPVVLDKLDAYNSLSGAKALGRSPRQMLLMVFVSRRRASRCARWMARRSISSREATAELAIVVVCAGDDAGQKMASTHGV